MRVVGAIASGEMSGGGLPELDTVAFGVGEPAEAAVVVVFAVRIDRDTSSG